MTRAVAPAEPEPSLLLRPARGATTAVALVLPGGKADSFDPTAARQLTGLRMQPFARSLHRRAGGDGLTVWTLRYRVRGWNGAEQSPVTDTRWALEEVRRRHGDVPIALVGHSMGGRTAIRVAGEPGVRGLVALAPWLPAGEPVAQLAGRRALIAHGSADFVTSPRASRQFADRARTVADELRYVSVRGESHAMLARWRTWHRLSTAYTLDLLGFRPVPAPVRAVLDRGWV